MEKQLLKGFKNILLTGVPGCGKSTIIEKVVSALGRPATGFFTRETREAGRRTGFALETLGGVKGILAHVTGKSPYRVGKYTVYPDAVDEIALPSLIPSSSEEIIVIDEIGKMECLSRRFQSAVIEALESDNPVLGSVALRGTRFIEDVKTRPDVLTIVVTPGNREDLVGELLAVLDE